MMHASVCCMPCDCHQMKFKYLVDVSVGILAQPLCVDACAPGPSGSAASADRLAGVLKGLLIPALGVLHRDTEDFTLLKCTACYGK